MKYHVKSLSFICVLSLSIMGQTPAPIPRAPVSSVSSEQARQRIINEKTRGLRISQEVFASPFSEDKVKAYMASLPKDQDLYVVEGDILLTEQEVRAYVVVKSQSEKPVDSSAELIVNVHNGTRDYYLDPSQRTLTYAVDRQSFPEEQMYNVAVENMRLATADWERACPDCKVKFSYVKEADLLPSTDKVNFVVRLRDVGGAYIAAAFFPHDGPVRRYLNLDPSYFKTSFNKTGVLRHELGHVLGYRHEHTRGVVGCFYEDNNWQPLTEYDPKSVMHYFCGGGGSFNLNLTDVDKAGHSKLYGQPATVGLTPSRNLRVRFEGPDLSKNLPQVFGTLSKLGLIEAKRYKVTTAGESLKSIYATNLQFPTNLISNSMLAYASSLNEGILDKKKLQPGQEVLYPDVKFKTYQKLVVLDPKDEKDRATYNDIWAKWPPTLITENKKEKDTDTISLALKGYELNLQLDSIDEEKQARSALLDLKKIIKANFLVLSSPVRASRPAIYSLISRTMLSETDFAPPSPSPTVPPQPTVSPEPTTSPEPAASPTVTKQSPEEFYELVVRQEGRVEAGIEGDLSLFLGSRENLSFPAHCTDNCPEIILMDKVVWLHPDIATAIKAGGSGEPGVGPIDSNTRKQVIRIEGGGEGILPFQHGTYMAGIIASQPNGFGLIGVNPQAEIISLDWDTLGSDSTQVTDFIVNRQTESENVSKKMQIFVFATEWRFRDSFANPTERFDSSNQNDPDLWRNLAKEIQNSRPLIIAAAGQSQSAEGTGTALNKFSQEGPRNLGDLPSVIVVTAYQKVTNPDGSMALPQLWPKANFVRDNEEKIIHVAAPGLQILSTVDNTAAGENAAYYGRGSGTSQATAFVAGVVSAMVGAWPGYYTDAALVKTRLQLTSNPFITRADASKLAAGIIDYNLAMHDQSKDWFRAKGDQNFSAVPHPKWLVDEIDLLDVDGNRIAGGPIKTRKIYRIMYKGDTCYIYTASPNKGEIKKYGPGKLRQRDLTELKLFEIKLAPNAEPKQYSLSEMTDLLFANANPR